jgi:leucine dehydrogenase
MLLALNGQYFTGEDVGLTLADADFLRERTPNVTGTTKGGSGNPSPVTAHGVFLGIKAALAHRRGSDALEGVTVAVQGLGSVGRTLCDKLTAEGAETDRGRHRRKPGARCGEVARRQGRSTDAILSARPTCSRPVRWAGCSRGDHPACEGRNRRRRGQQPACPPRGCPLMMERGILYAPDYVINGGGLINVAAELAPGGYDREDAMARVARIPEVLADIFRRVRRRRPADQRHRPGDRRGTAGGRAR